MWRHSGSDWHASSATRAISAAGARPMPISITRAFLIFEPQRLCSPPLPVMAQATNALQFSGHLHLRHRLVLSILSGKAVKIDKIRSEDKNPGLRGTHALAYVPPFRTDCCIADYEVSLLRLLERITNGTIIEISVTGASCACLAWSFIILQC